MVEECIDIFLTSSTTFRAERMLYTLCLDKMFVDLFSFHFNQIHKTSVSQYVHRSSHCVLQT